MSKSFNKIIALTFAIYLGGFLVLQIAAKDKSFSELENRVLAEKPEWIKKDFLDGTYGEAFETYIADQFPMRNTFISVKSLAELLQGKKDNNGVYIGEDGYLLQKFETPDKELLEKNAVYLNAFGERFNTYLMMVPTATKVYEDKLPSFATPYDEKEFIETFKSKLDADIQFIELLEIMEAKEDEYIYYKTDHHWTTLGAYYGYTAFCQAYGIEPLGLEKFNQVSVSKSFYGSLFSKGNFTYLKPDTLHLFEPKDKAGVSVNYVATNKVTDTFYEMSRLETKDKYSVFLDSNHPMITIQTGMANGKKLAVVKDSYANSMIPFLANHFEEIHILDLRFLNMPIATYVREQGIEDVLLLYNVQNFAVENKLSLLGK